MAPKGGGGRRKDRQQAINVHRKDLHMYLDKYFVTSMIDIGNDIYTLLIKI